MIRNPVVSGAFYPGNKPTLVNQINQFLVKTKKILTSSPRILIVPHAGYIYSGLTAAWGYKQLEKSSINKVILLGISHNNFFNQAAFFNEGTWSTPIGKIKVDDQLATNLIKQSKYFEANQLVHEQEHSLEVQLPFLQTVLTDFKIVPILLSQTSEDLLISLAKAISQYLNDKTILVISSDLSHYPEFKIANMVDKQTIDGILSGDTNKFNQVINRGMSLPEVDTCACGGEAIKAGMMVAKILKLKTIKLINYANSGDITGDYSRVVGYASIGFYSHCHSERKRGI